LSQLGGTYNGSITFVAPNKRFIWFAAQVNAASPKPEGEVKITTFVRKGELHGVLTVLNLCDFVLQRPRCPSA
jgi:hypothetical protein